MARGEEEFEERALEEDAESGASDARRASDVAPRISGVAPREDPTRPRAPSLPSGFFPRRAPLAQPVLSPAAKMGPDVAFRETLAPEVSLPPATRGALHPLDAALLDTLDAAFTRHAGGSGQLDAAELQAALGIRNRLLAERLLTVFDQNSDGVVTRAEFLDRVRRLLYGPATDKLRFAFRIHDLNGDNLIERAEILDMIRASIAEEGSGHSGQDPDELTDLVFAAADKNADGFLSYREFEAAVNLYPAVLETITRCEACWIAPNKDILRRPPESRSYLRQVRRTLVNQAPQVVLVTLWALANVALGVHAALRYHGQGANGFVMLARSMGAGLNFNGALILIPVMRRLLTWARRKPALALLPVDDAVAFHRLVGHTMFAQGLLHTGAHLANYRVSQVGMASGVFGSSSGLTGFFLLTVFVIMWLASLPQVRRSSRFELFYFTHLLYLAWMALCLAHGPVFYLWAGVPLLGFFAEQVLRRQKRARATEITQMLPRSSGVTELRMRRPEGFRHRAGDYAFLRLPALARHEWHPFTISSAPERADVSMHVRSLGNFTRALREFSEQRQLEADTAPLVAHLDGPYGTPSAGIFEAQNVVLVGAGIGVTPFASVLESIVLRANDGGPGPKKVHFFWLNRDAYSFEWFAELLLGLERIDRNRLVDIHIYMTDGRGHVTATALNLARAISHELGRPDLITGLRSKTNLGRTDWKTELGKIVELHRGEPVDLFFCGPAGLGSVIRRTCREVGVKFRQEHF